MFKKLTVRSRVRIILCWTLVLAATLIALFLIGNQSTTAQREAVTQTQPGDTLVVQTNSGSIVTSAAAPLNAQTDAGLRALLEKYPGTWKAYLDKGRARTLRPVSRIPVRADPREFSSQLLTDVSQVFGIAAPDAAYTFILSWKIVVKAKEGLFSFTYYLDDANGLVVKKYSNVYTQKSDSACTVDRGERRVATCIVDAFAA